MSRISNISATATSPAADQSDDEIRLQINLRLRLDEVAESQAKDLRAAPRHPPSRQELCRLACRIYDARRTRDRMIDRQLFGEPAWDILLSLYCLPARGERLTVTSLTYAANLAGTTGHRWQAVLTKEGLIERGPQDLDARKQFVRLTDQGRALMTSYLTRLFYCDTPMPVPPESGR